MLKRIITLALLTVLVAAIGSGTNSCSEPSEIDTTRLISAPLNSFTGTLTRADPTGSFAVSQTCGCPFNYTVTAYGGDTSVIHFTVNDSSQSLTTHIIPTAIYPSQLPAGPDTVDAWIALYYFHNESPPNSGIPLYDTIRVTAIY